MPKPMPVPKPEPGTPLEELLAVGRPPVDRREQRLMWLPEHKPQVVAPSSSIAITSALAESEFVAKGRKAFGLNGASVTGGSSVH
jgi:hypothetical protein